MGDLPLPSSGADLENLPNRKGFLVPEPALALKLRETATARCFPASA